MIYFISDTHFNHENIIEYCNRPFKNFKEMNERIIKNWNDIINENDIIYHLGDLALGRKELIFDITKRLKGKKYLIRGNHDKWSVNTYEELGFEVLKNSPIKLEIEKLLLSHIPVPDKLIQNGFVNIHGHIHNNPLHKINPETNEMEYPEDLYSEKLHINVSVDVIGFQPISLKELLKKVEEKK